MEIISREAAKLQGLKLFLTGVPCHNGHASQRYVSTGGCRQCALDKLEERQETTRDRVQQHYAANRDKILKKKRLYYQANRETVKARSKAYREGQPPKPPKRPRFDMIGQVFGKLTVFREATAEERGTATERLWVCVCSCGATDVIRSGYGLREVAANGGISSCGCHPKRLPIDVTGERYGLLIALRPDALLPRGISWLFRCDCGTECVIRLGDVRSGNTASCGCLKKNRHLWKRGS